MNDFKPVNNIFYNLFATTFVPVISGVLFVVWIIKSLNNPIYYFPVIALLIFALYYISGKIYAGLLTAFAVITGLFLLIFMENRRDEIIIIYFSAWLVFFYLALEFYSQYYLSVKNKMDSQYETFDRKISVAQSEIENSFTKVSNISQKIENFKTVGKMIETFQIIFEEKEIIDKSADLAFRLIGAGSWQLKKDLPSDVFAQYVKKTGLPLIITDLSYDGRFKVSQSQYLSVIAVPVELNGKFWGILFGVSPKANAFGDANLRLLATLSGIISEFLNNSYFYDQLKILSVTDGLTSLYTQSFFKERLKDEMRRTKITGDSFTVAMIDIDFFKKINDTYGHQSGDLVLSRLAFILRERFRKSDFIARYGGEEFGVILMHSYFSKAEKILEEIRETVEQENFYLNPLAKINLTVSIGFAEFNSEGSLLEDELIKRADKALYEAKNSGRNAVAGAKLTNGGFKNDKKN